MIRFRTRESAEKPPDIDLIDAMAARDDPEAFARLYDRYVQPVYRYLLSRIGSIEEAEDMTAQTFLAAMESLPRYDHRGLFTTWLFSIARRKAADYFRRRPSIPLDEATSLAVEADLAWEVARRDQVRRLARLIQTLEPEERELIRLHFTAGLTFAETASVLGKKEDAVKKSLYRLLARLRDRLE